MLIMADFKNKSEKNESLLCHKIYLCNEIYNAIIRKPIRIPAGKERYTWFCSPVHSGQVYLRFIKNLGH